MVTLTQNQARLDRILGAFRAFGSRERQQGEAALAGSERSLRRLARLLVGTALAGAAASLLVGFLWARRITKPIYELQVQVESAAERTRIQVRSDNKGEFDGLGDQVAALIGKLEETDAALAEHRRRLIQSEKLSAIGELAAKLAHEVLNPLAGMKAAVQLLARAHPHDPDRARETARALSAEIARVEELLGRLLNFARPLSPRVEVTSVSGLLDAAVAATRDVDRAQPGRARALGAGGAAAARGRSPAGEPGDREPARQRGADHAVGRRRRAGSDPARGAGSRRGRDHRRRSRRGHRPRRPAHAVSPVLHHQAQRPRAGPGDQPEHRRRARRPHRGRQPAGGRRHRGRSFELLLPMVR